MVWFKRKKAIIQPVIEEKSVSSRLEDAIKAKGDSSNTYRETLLEYIQSSDRRLEHQDHEIRRLKIKKDIDEIGESSHKGFYRECTMTIRFFKHLYEFVIGEGLAPEKVQKYIGSAKKALYVLAAVAVLSAASSIYSGIAMKRTLEQNRDLLSLEDTTKNNSAAIISNSKQVNKTIGELEKKFYEKSSLDIAEVENKMRKAFSGIIINKDEQIATLANNNLQLLDQANYLEGIISEQQEQVNFSSLQYERHLAQDSADKTRIETIVSTMSNQLFKTEQKYNSLIENLNKISEQTGGFEGRLLKLERLNGIYLPEENLFKLDLPLKLRNYKTD